MDMPAVMDIHRVDNREAEEAYPLLRVHLEKTCMDVVEAGIRTFVEEDIHRVDNRKAEDEASLVLVQVDSTKIGLEHRLDELLDQSLHIPVKEIPWPFCKSLVRLNSCARQRHVSG